MDYSALSRELTKQISKSDKKGNGIFFTPPKTIQKNLQIIEPYISNISKVLEPSCGSGEYIRALDNKFDNLNITGIEFNDEIYDSIQNTYPNVIHTDYISYESSEKYDLIIGNPPYFVMKKGEVDKKYYEYFTGRPNIFIVFIIKSLGLLADGGILSFVLPRSFLNCLYYDATRRYIHDNFKILDIVECDDAYIETQQKTIILVVQKTAVGPQPPVVLTMGNYVIFGTVGNIKKIKELLEGSTTMERLGITVKVGTVVWNECKSELTTDPTHTRLIYSSDIVDNKLSMKTYKNVSKKNYIDRPGVTGPCVIINRGYGVGNYNFEYCLVENIGDYLLENHIIYATTTRSDDLMKSFDDKRTGEFIELYFGNNAINATEIQNILPIYVD